MEPDVLDAGRAAIVRRLASEYADEYLDRFLLPTIAKITGVPPDEPAQFLQAMLAPANALEVLFVQYAFSRRGKERGVLNKAIEESLDEFIGERPFDEAVDRDAAELWDLFSARIEARDKKVNENRDRGIVQGLFELAQEIHEQDGVGSVAKWVLDGVRAREGIEPHFNRLVDIRGFGPKNASNYLRDLVVLFDIENDIHPQDRLLYQTVDKWIREAAQVVVPEEIDRPQDWIIAGKINKYTRLARVSGARFNMGCSSFGNLYAGRFESFEDALWSLVETD